MKNIEIEFKFLVNPLFFKNHIKNKIIPIKITQAYIHGCKGYHTRVRLESLKNREKGTITTKTGSKPSRIEFEQVLDTEMVKTIIAHSTEVLVKERYLYIEGNFQWYIDFYPDFNYIVAEIELPSLDSPFPRPQWLGKDVTLDKKYSNQELAKRKKRSRK